MRDALLAELARGGGVRLGKGQLILDAYGGALNRPRAAPRRSCTATSATRSSTSPTTTTAARRAARGCGACTRIVAPHASGAYQNYIDPDLRGWRRAYYGRNLERLETVREPTTRTAASARRAGSNKKK